MKKKRMNFSKRAFALMLAVSMVFSNSFVVNAANSAKADGASTGLSEAADGTPSKVIGLEVKPGYSSIYNKDGKQKLATYNYARTYYATRTPIVAGTAEDYKDAVTGLYVYNGEYYTRYSSYTSGGNKYVYFYSKPVFFDGTLDEATRCYLVGGKYYASCSKTTDGRYYVDPYYEVILFGNYPNRDAFLTAHGVKLDPAKESYDYIQKDGRVFYRGGYSYKFISKGNYLYYGYLNDEYIMNSATLNIKWNQVTVGDKYVSSDNKLVQVGYELELNGEIYPYSANIITTDGRFLTSYTGVTPSYPILKAGESATVRVRAVYYTKTEVADAQGNTVTNYNTYKTGGWSDMYTYTYNGLTTKEVPALQLTAVQDDDVIKVDWNRNNDVKYYTLEYIFTNTAINVNADNWDDYHTSNSAAWKAVKEANPNLEYSYSSNSYISKTQSSVKWKQNMPICYFMVKPYELVQDYDIIRYTYSNIASVTAVSKGINTPAISDFKVIKTTSGGLVLNWTPVDANVVIYAYEQSTFPAYYYYSLLGAYAEVTDEKGKVQKKYLSDSIDEVTKATVDKKVKSFRTSGENGECSLYGLEAGKKYYFVAHTYDATDSSVAKATPVAVIDNIAYNYYTAMGPATNVVSGKMTLGKPGVVTLSGKTSIKLSLSNGSTGYEIYRKSGKKWKKLTTTMDNYYIDENLKKNKEYSYRVRSFYYNEDTKVKGYSDYVYITATTGTVNAIMLTASKKSSKSVKLSWNKVSGATKYEIYRSDEYSGDPAKLYAKYSTSNWDSYIASEKFELIKTIKKASTTSYTNKGLKAGHNYSYIIKAYYKNGKKAAFIYDYATVSMEVDTPKMVKTVNSGTSVKVSWTKDPYAKKYEVAYMLYNSEGYTDAKTYTIQSTSKASYIIKDVEKGGYVKVKVRAIGKNGKYSSWSTTNQGVSLAGAKSVKATNVFAKNAAGKKVAAVKITWKKVSGASYYMVYRTTKKPAYYSSSKMYASYGDLIAKESNDDTSNSASEVHYKDLNNIDGSITGTSAIDCAQLDTGVDYYYTVVAYGPYGTEIASYAAYKNSSKVFGSGSYGKVTFNTKLTVTAKVSKKKVKLTWNKIPGVTKYVVYRATSKKGKYTKIATVTKGKVTYTDKKVTKGKTYYYKIVATGKNVLKNKFEVKSAAKKIKAK